MVMIDRSTQHEQPKLDRVLAAHKRRARLIAQLHEQAIAAANDDLSATGTTKHARSENADRTFATALLKVAAVAILIAGLGCILLALWL
jgi:hypothetical protein